MLGEHGIDHRQALDEPLALLRLEYSDSLPGPLTVLPQQNWQGHHDGGVFTSTKRCKTITNSTELDPDSTPENGGSEPEPGRTGSYEHCVTVDWPAKRMWSTMERRREMHGPVSWMGSLVEHQRDQTGQVYQRNRYYEPSTGRFTQEDPIGLAGGINLYGFAEGDPVTYSDRFGFSPSDCTWWPAVHSEWPPSVGVGSSQMAG